MLVVLDASAAVDLLLPVPRQNAALNAVAGADLYVPQIIDAEVMSALARLERARVVTIAEADLAHEHWLSLPVTRVPNELLLPDVWQLRHSIRISDGFYVAAAVRLRASLITSDARLARAPLPDITVTLLH